MKKNILYLAIALLLIINASTLSKVNSLSFQVQQYENHVRNLENEIRNMDSSFEEMLDKKSSILDSFDIRFGEKLNPDNLTVPVTIAITPKELDEGMTAAVQINGEKIEMKKTGTSFEASFDASIFEDLSPKVVLEADGVQKTESLEGYNDIRFKYLLSINGGYSGNKSYKNGSFQYKGNLNLFIADPMNNSPQKITIIGELNGDQVSEKTVELKTDTPENRIEPELMGEAAMNAGDKFLMYAKVEDSYGIVYKYVFLAYELGEEGKPSASYPEWTNGSIAEISDKNGTVLYAEEFFKNR